MSGGLLQLAGAVIDLVHRVGALPASGEEVEASDLLITAGGGFNAMAAARRAGATVTYGGALGTGLFADVLARALAAEGIALANPRRVGIEQGTCVVVVEANGERSFITHHGAERQIDRARLDSLGAERFDWVLLSAYALFKPHSAAAFLPWLQSLPRPPQLFFDPGPVVGGIPRAAIDTAMRRADWVSANRREAQCLTALTNPREQVQALAAGRAGAIVRDGAAGCWLATAGAVEQVAGFSVECIDSTGAGDTHAGAFLAALMQGHRPLAAAVFANAAAALSTTRQGPATAPEAGAVLDFLKQHGVALEAVAPAMGPAQPATAAI
jgi:sugar/nucleoside kinase (ribokinase family)